MPAYPDSVVLSGGATGIPAGSYLISGQVDADRLGSGSAEIRCFLDWTGGGSSDAADLYVSTTSGDAAPMAGEMSVDSATTLTVDCQELSGGTPGISVVARVHAIRVGTLHTD